MRHVKFLINFIFELIFLTIVFHYFGLSFERSFVAALILSLILDGAYILHRKALKTESRKEVRKLTRGDYIVLALIIIVCLVYGTLGIHHVLVIPLVYSFLIGVILTIFAVLAYVTGVKKWKRGRKVYSMKQFLYELIFMFIIFLPTYFSGVSLLKSLAAAFYVYLLIHWYYNFKPHIYVFPKKYLIFRNVLIFFGTFLGWLTLVKANLILCFLIAALTTFMLELDRRCTVKLAEAVGFEEMERRSSRAGAIFQPLGLLYGMLVGVMTVSNIYGTWYFAEWSVDLYRLAYLFTPPFLTVEALIGWIYVKVKLDKEKSKSSSLSK